MKRNLVQMPNSLFRLIMDYGSFSPEVGMSCYNFGKPFDFPVYFPPAVVEKFFSENEPFVLLSDYDVDFLVKKFFDKVAPEYDIF